MSGLAKTNHSLLVAHYTIRMALRNHPPKLAPDHKAALLAERRAQLRALLLLAFALLIFFLLRGRPLDLFHPGWWRL